MTFGVVIQEFRLHLGHIDAGRAFALAPFAANAKLHGFQQMIGREGVRSQLSRQRQPERIGAASGQVLFVPRRAEGRAHDTGVGLSTGAVVVAHFHGAPEAAPIGPVKSGLKGDRLVARLEAEQTAVVHF